MARLPEPGKDAGNWGDILNSYLNVAHQTDGSLKPISQSNVVNLTDDLAAKYAKPSGGIPSSDLTAAVQASLSKSDNAVQKGEIVFNVKDYGAKGDGTTDDTAAIQAALNAAYTAGGATVFVPTGTFMIDPNPGLQIKSATTLRGAGAGTIIKLVNNCTHDDNMVKSESWSNVTVEDLVIDGNRSNQAGSYDHTQYGIYFGGVARGLIQNVRVQSTTGVGIHVYNSHDVSVVSCYSTDNHYHGYELEQVTACHVTNSSGNANSMHGVLVSPGEVGGTGSRGISVVGCTFDNNGNYGIATNAANGDMSAFLSVGNIFTNNTITNNAFYGVNFYKQNSHIFNNNYVANNGYFGLYAFESANNSIQNNTFVANSKAGNGVYDEIMLEGYSTDAAHPAGQTIIAGNTILINGTNKARYAINEASSGDGPNTIFGNVVPFAGTAGVLHIQHPATQMLVDNQTTQTISGAKSFANTVTGNQGFEVSPNATLASGMGLDAPFGTAALRFYNGSAGGNIQLVAPNGNLDAYIGGSSVFSVTPAEVVVQNKFRIATTSTPASATAAGATGTVTWDSDYVYVCVADNVWRRSALSAW